MFLKTSGIAIFVYQVSCSSSSQQFKFGLYLSRFLKTLRTYQESLYHSQSYPTIANLVFLFSFQSLTFILITNFTASVSFLLITCPIKTSDYSLIMSIIDATPSILPLTSYIIVPYTIFFFVYRVSY